MDNNTSFQQFMNAAPQQPVNNFAPQAAPASQPMVDPRQQGITNSWSLMSFARQFGAMSVANLKRKSDGHIFKSCAFRNPNTNAVTFVAFSSNLGELTPAQIAASKDSLQVVRLTGGNYKLCKVGENSWQSVDLGL